MRFGLDYGGSDGLDERCDLAFWVPTVLDCIDGCFYGSAALVAEHHNQFHAFFNGVFKASQHGIINHLSSRACHKHVSEALVEYEFGRDARIYATENGCPWMLALSNLCLSFG